MVYKVSFCLFFGKFFVLIVAQLDLGITPFTEVPRCKLPFTENSRTYNSMLCVLLLRILDLLFYACCHGTSNSMHATFSLRILGLLNLTNWTNYTNLATCYKLNKSSTVSLGPTLPAVCTLFCLVCGCLLKKKKRKK